MCVRQIVFSRALHPYSNTHFNCLKLKANVDLLGLQCEVITNDSYIMNLISLFLHSTHPSSKYHSCRLFKLFFFFYLLLKAYDQFKLKFTINLTSSFDWLANVCVDFIRPAAAHDTGSMCQGIFVILIKNEPLLS